ncbi:hypothetical protein GGI07_002975 [Coemansia sp. Benny D115]|nr:hypothetical protein GGI07_002975 [Coemansia sp. Benny D115]
MATSTQGGMAGIDIAIDDNQNQFKETDSLPLPSTTPGCHKESLVSQRFALILQYLNPLFYARLAQSFINSVLESYRDSNSGSNYAVRITAGDMVTAQGPIPPDAAPMYCVPDDTAIGNANHAGFTTVSPTFDYPPKLDLDLSMANITVEESSDAQEQSVVADEQVGPSSQPAVVAHVAKEDPVVREDSAVCGVDEPKPAAECPSSSPHPYSTIESPAVDANANANTETNLPVATPVAEKKNKRNKNKSKGRGKNSHR